jgi:hypothetical protein
MQLAHITIKHGAKHYHAIRRINVTPAEVLLLKTIHGADAVPDRDIVYAGEADRSVAEEMANLQRIYGGKEEIKKMISDTFPGARPSLPLTFEESASRSTAASSRPSPKAEPKEGELISRRAPMLKPRPTGAEAALA